VQLVQMHRTGKNCLLAFPFIHLT